jgi:hypothetical protein
MYSVKASDGRFLMLAPITTINAVFALKKSASKEVVREVNMFGHSDVFFNGDYNILGVDVIVISFYDDISNMEI